MDPLGGLGPLMWALFVENVCENERIGSRRGWRGLGMPPLDLPMIFHEKITVWICLNNYQSFLLTFMKEKQVELAAENHHVNPMDIPVTSDLDPKLPANQRGLAIRL